MSDFAKDTRNIVPITAKSATTNRALLERLSHVENALMGAQRTSSSQEDEENGAQMRIKKWVTRLLAEGGYNHIWLILILRISL